VARRRTPDRAPRMPLLHEVGLVEPLVGTVDERFPVAKQIRTPADEGFNETDFVQKRHPRSAVGRTAAGDLIFFAVDGRTNVSVGMSLPELATKMARLGCVEAINLDGGGSTALSLFGAALNRPSDGRERNVAAGVVFFGETAKDSRQPTLVFRRAEEGGYLASLQLGGKPVPNAEIFWSSVGDAWIDQGGGVLPIKDGTVTVRAAWKGRVIANAYPVKVEKKKK
ncbi:phosphodiester glycosidase family protein, partial [bacterium]